MLLDLFAMFWDRFPLFYTKLGLSAFLEKNWVSAKFQVFGLKMSIILLFWQTLAFLMLLDLFAMFWDRFPLFYTKLGLSAFLEKNWV